MVSLKNLLIAGAAFFIIDASPIRHANEIGALVTSAQNDGSPVHVDSRIVKRMAGRQMLQWAPDGTILYLLGSIGTVISSLPAELQNMITHGSQATPAQVLLENFHQYILSHHTPAGAFDLFVGQQLFNEDQVNFGGVYGVGGAALNMWGFAFSFAANNIPNAADLQGLVSAIEAFAQQDGGIITVVQRANGFFNPARIGAGISLIGRTRNDQCPATRDLLQFATADVPQDLDFNRLTRWAEPCLGTST